MSGQGGNNGQVVNDGQGTGIGKALKLQVKDQVRSTGMALEAVQPTVYLNRDLFFSIVCYVYERKNSQVNPKHVFYKLPLSLLQWWFLQLSRSQYIRYAIYE
ncbi:hypothetical protein OUZ56_005290 [Daphnia magna]|uniref:Uncharacterized protein n=1 Tax=Daphnia magna TaxID=35525 RepID=A0ABQ9YSD9_9CRUS|nr:hypothetical protein OUZ56_005290 [Daphnia magna]